jgi:MPBQ/MSBQ methyltransferase
MSQRAMIDGYDTAMQGPVIETYYGCSDFYNFGFWIPDTLTQSQASENLVAHLLEFIPSTRRTGRILDVACGLGASSRYLSRYFEPSQITGINISPRQLERARANAPDCNFLVMDATRLQFPDEFFDNILCVEAAFHFDTRAAFLREALRVLKPGGRLVHSDILMATLPPATAARMHIPNANALTSLAELESMILDAGFATTEVLDATEQCWRPFLRSVREFKKAHRRAAPASARRQRSAPMFFNPEYVARFLRHYALACSQKAAN